MIPATTTAMTAAAARITLKVLFMTRCPPRAEDDPLTGSMGLVQDGIDNAVRQDIDPVRQVGGKEAVWIARRGHARCS